MSNSLLAIASLLSVLDPEGVVTTAPAGYQAVPVGAVAPTAAEVPPVSSQAITPHGLTTEQQIDHWLSARTAEDRPFADDGPDPWRMTDDRKMHGEVSAAIGTGDYTAYSASVSLPVGETGRLDLHYSESKNDPWAYYGYGRGYPGYGHGYGDYGYRSGRSQSIGFSFQSDSSSGDRRPAGAGPAGRSPVWRDGPRDPAAPLDLLD